jgi:hypothetical protein
VKKILALYIALSVNILSQELTNIELIGVWQKGSEIVGSGYSDCYQFYPNGKFIFNFSQSNDSRRIISIQGYYRLDKDSLITKIESRTEKIGGYIRRGFLGYEAEWCLDSAKTKVFKQSNTKEESYRLKLFQGSVLNFVIESREDLHYFKISSDPDSYNN